MEEKIIIDTDIGDDIDDALALGFALRLDGIKLLGITTVFGDTDKRARIAAKICDLAGADVPVYAGCEMALDKNGKSGTCCQYTDELADSRYAPKGGAQQAVQFIVDCAERYGDKLTIVGLGPMTNLAQAFLLAPDTMLKVKKYVLMCGCFYAPHLEWNVVCDPLAAKTVLESGARIYCVGLDVTKDLGLGWKEQSYILGHSDDDGMSGYIASLARVWVNKYGRNITLHDPLALYTAVDDDVVFFEKNRVVVETEGQVTRAMTFVTEAMSDAPSETEYEDSVCVSNGIAGGPVYCGMQVRKRAFMTKFMYMLFGIKEKQV